MVNNLDQRMIFKNALELAKKLGLNIDETKCTQAFIRSERLSRNYAKIQEIERRVVYEYYGIYRSKSNLG